MPEPCSYDYAVIRVVPDVTRQEFVNAGVILFCRALRFLAAQVHLDVQRLAALAPGIDVDAVQRQLDLLPAICAGEGPVGGLGQAEAFHWIVAPHSTMIQCSPVHSGITLDPAGEMARLMSTLVE
ncbi:MAG: DUF3037 domain-containing protein [Caldilinea sp.]|nr:DUF3037 domain-containing protein [Caldilinea sp.]MCB0150697.1 DUF3037 domain-containing protein [Caldilineaceae bacterium]MCB9121345.1 DUF3037 domain-containing protein [Caldilineaceae bacterium]MCO5210753.1 DUF3037 domain-containing protein [Caldilinea sp.]MCW5843378.1 DUF3037 domain-containing protein [Caldilinea sp.]